MAKLSEDDIERQQVEAVFSLGGGELNDGVMTYTYKVDGETREGRFVYTYEGVPEYARADFGMGRGSAGRNDEGCEFFTVARDCMYGLPPEEIDVEGRTYVRVESFTTSGEAQCPADGCDPDPFEGEDGCPLCEGQAGEHGCVYLGEGWAEVVYKHDTTEHMRKVARTHNIRIWSEEAATCNDCGTTWPRSRAGAEHHEDYCEDLNGERSHLPGVWWWESCSPGCLPDAETSGPFDDEREALEDATEGLLD